MNRTRIMGIVAGGTLTVAVVALETVAGRRVSRRLARALTRAARYQTGRLEGFRYRLAGRHPDLGVTNGVLADRVRSVLGPLEHRLDVPRVHVLAEGHDVLLHGEVDSEEHARELIKTVRAIPGVGQVKSHLQVGLLPGATKPSEGTSHHPPSAGLSSVLAAAHSGGAPVGTERAAARSVLSTFATLLPAGERRHVLGHLPADLRPLAEPPRPRFVKHRPSRRLDSFTRAALPTLDPEVGRAVVESVIGALRDLVPEEDHDVAAVLPSELRHLWKTAIPA